jgi:hypothetical protein
MKRREREAINSQGRSELLKRCAFNSEKTLKKTMGTRGSKHSA